MTRGKRESSDISCAVPKRPNPGAKPLTSSGVGGGLWCPCRSAPGPLGPTCSRAELRDEKGLLALAKRRPRLRGLSSRAAVLVRMKCPERCWSFCRGGARRESSIPCLSASSSLRATLRAHRALSSVVVAAVSVCGSGLLERPARCRPAPPACLIEGVRGSGQGSSPSRTRPASGLVGA